MNICHTNNDAISIKTVNKDIQFYDDIKVIHLAGFITVC